MPTPPLSEHELQLTIKMVAECDGNLAEAGRRLGIARTTVQHRMQLARTPRVEPINALDRMQDRIRELEAALSTQKRETLDERYVKSKIIGLAEMKPRVPAWLLSEHKAANSPGTPTLLLSDLHWGEVVDPEQVGGVNEYNIEIANARLRRTIDTACGLLQHHMVNPNYPGIVLAIAGDAISGDIHDELSATNEREVMPVVLDLWGALAWAIETLADRFGKVFVPAVSGNHARNTKKIRSKGRNFTSFDWLVYNFLAKHFEEDKRVSFFVPDGPDALYSVHGHRYLLTHGDQFRGGDSMIGALGPIVRGDHRKRSRNGQIGMAYDTIVMGHWHQLMQTQRFIVGGSLVGYGEYAYNGNFPFEPPRQAMWITHPGKGITFHMPVMAEDTPPHDEPAWVAWPH